MNRKERKGKKKTWRSGVPALAPFAVDFPPNGAVNTLQGNHLKETQKDMGVFHFS